MKIDLSNIKIIKKYFPEYHIIKVIGQGGQKIVYLCLAPSKKEVVLKLIACDNENSIDRAIRELKFSIALPSSYYAKIIDYGVKKIDSLKTIYIVEEYIKGNSLRMLLDSKDNKQLTMKETKNIVSSLLEALEILEERSLVHRDIKPDNIIVNDKKVILIDFGIARHLDMPSLTASYNFFGPLTPGYGAPEQIKNEKRKISSRTDLFALGILCYEMIYGVNPFIDGSKNMNEIFKKTLTMKISCNTKDQYLDYFVNSCLEKNPSKRPHSIKFAKSLFSKIKWEE